MPATELVSRLQKLGLDCSDVPLDSLNSATLALACFPMYMVANVHAWTKDKQFQIPVAGGLPGSEAIREAFEIGKQERPLAMTREHKRILGSLLSGAKPSDLVIYEFAVETLRLFLSQAEAKIAEQTRVSVARSILAVAKASGEGFFGSGEKVSPEERACIEEISQQLGLAESAEAAGILKTIDQK